jgi:hypothetical protein
LTVTFPIQNGLKQGDVLPPLLFNIVLHYQSSEGPINLVGVKLNGIHKLFICADDVNLLVGNTDDMKFLAAASKEVGLNVNAVKTEYMLPSSQQTAGQNHHIKKQTGRLEMWHSSNSWERQ